MACQLRVKGGGTTYCTDREHCTYAAIEPGGLVPDHTFAFTLHMYHIGKCYTMQVTTSNIDTRCPSNDGLVL